MVFVLYICIYLDVCVDGSRSLFDVCVDGSRSLFEVNFISFEMTFFFGYFKIKFSNSLNFLSFHAQAVVFSMHLDSHRLII